MAAGSGEVNGVPSGEDVPMASEVAVPPQALPAAEKSRGAPPQPSGAAPGVRDSLALLAMVVLCDMTIYRGHGFAGIALLLVAAPLLLWLGHVRPRWDTAATIVVVLLGALAVKLLWCGSALAVALGLALLAAFAMSLSGQIPYVLELAVFASQTIRAGYEGLVHYGRGISRLGPPVRSAPLLAVLLPLAAFLVFGMVFVLANPDLLATFSERVGRVLRQLREWLLTFSLFEMFFWVVVFWLSLGLMRPLRRKRLDEPQGESPFRRPKARPAELYAACRNTLLTVIGLFAIYLVFEFQTLWFREFPAGFHYSGYAHEGAAWLTVALALSTVTLSQVFRGAILEDPRLETLRRLAWVWSALNFLLAIAVYNRLLIYVGFNGMTRMRTVAFFGISVVVVGFALVVWKIAYNRSFIWLLRRHLWALALTIYLFALTPVDTLVVRYNVRRILAGDPAPCVQISVHPINSEGVLLLLPLLECPNDVIREGVRALLAERDEQAEALAARRREEGWTAFQIADQLVHRRLQAARPLWSAADDTAQREETLRRFHDYAYQWY